MANVELSIQDAARSGTVVVYNTSTTVPPLTASDRFQIPNNGTVQILVKNGATASIITVETPSTVDGLAVADREVTVAADTDVIIGPFPAFDLQRRRREPQRVHRRRFTRLACRRP